MQYVTLYVLILGPAFCYMNGERIRRENAEQYAAWVEALGGDGNAGIRLWQDTGINLAVYYIRMLLI